MKSTRVLQSLLLSCACLALPAIANADTVTVTGAAFGTNGVPAFPGYGTGINNNNVVNSPASGLVDVNNGTTWRAVGDDPVTPAQVTSNIAGGLIDWYFVGAESGGVSTLTVPGLGGFTHSENNENNNIGGPATGPQYLGTTANPGGVIPFSLSAPFSGLATAANGANNRTPQGQTGVSSMVFSYVNVTAWNATTGTAFGWELVDFNGCTPNCDWFAFAFDDAGSSNDNHDDYIGIARVYADGAPDPTPLPAALPLMATVLGGGYLLSKWRRRRRVADEMAI